MKKEKVCFLCWNEIKHNDPDFCKRCPLSACSECRSEYIDFSSRPISCPQCKNNLPHLNKIRREREKKRQKQTDSDDFFNMVSTIILYACIILSGWYVYLKWIDAIANVENNPHRFYPHCLLTKSEMHDLDLYYHKVITQFLEDLCLIPNKFVEVYSQHF